MFVGLIRDFSYFFLVLEKLLLRVIWYVELLLVFVVLVGFVGLVVLVVLVGLVGFVVLGGFGEGM